MNFCVQSLQLVSLPWRLSLHISVMASWFSIGIPHHDNMQCTGGSKIPFPSQCQTVLQLFT